MAMAIAAALTLVLLAPTMLPWPYPFQSKEEYDAELAEAMEQDDGFKRWLLEDKWTMESAFVSIDNTIRYDVDLFKTPFSSIPPELKTDDLTFERFVGLWDGYHNSKIGQRGSNPPKKLTRESPWESSVEELKDAYVKEKKLRLNAKHARAAFAAAHMAAHEEELAAVTNGVSDIGDWKKGVVELAALGMMKAMK